MNSATAQSQQRGRDPQSLRQFRRGRGKPMGSFPRGRNQESVNQTAAQGAPVFLTQSTLVSASYGKNCASFRVGVRSEQSSLGKALIERGYSVRVVGGAEDNKHAFSAAMRQLATVHALKCLHSRHEPFKVREVVDIFGSVRTYRLHADVLCRDKAFDPLSLKVFRPLCVGEDVKRMPPPEALVDSLTGASGLLMVDVYACGDKAFSPLTIVELMGGREKVPLYWVGFRFSGEMGVMNGEGAWVRENGLIVYQPDSSSVCYSPHDALDWIWDGDCTFRLPNGLTLFWYLERTFEDVQVVHFELTSIFVQPQSLRKIGKFFTENTLVYEYQGFVGWLQSKLCTYFDFIPAAWFKRCFVFKKMAVYKPLWKVLTQRSTGLFKNKLTLNALMMLAEDFAKKDKELQVLYDAFPQKMTFYVRSLCYAAYVHQLDLNVGALQALSLNNDLMEMENDLRDSIGRDTKNVSLTKSVLASVGVAIVGLGALRYLWPKADFKAVAGVSQMDVRLLGARIHQDLVLPALDFFAKPFVKILYSIFGAPLIEELIKKFLPGKGRDFSIFESGQKMLNFGVGGWVVHMLLTHPMHCLTGEMSYPLAVLVHCLWNLFFLAPAWLPYFQGSVQGKSSFWLLSLLFCLLVIRYLRSRNVKKVSPFNLFRDHFYVQPWDLRTPWVGDKSVTSFDPLLSVVPTQRDSKIIVSRNRDKNLVYTNTFESFSKVSVNSNCYWFLPTQIPAYVPAATDANMIAVIESRILVEAPLEPIIQNKNWSKWFWLVDVLPQCDSIDWLEWIDLWINHFEDNMHIRRFRAALEQCVKMGFSAFKDACRKTQLMVKRDEWLMKFDAGVPMMKPRGIANVNPRVQVRIGPEIFAATVRLKNFATELHPLLFSIDFEGRQTSFSFAYAGCATDHSLSAWWRSIECHQVIADYHILVSGDDSLVIDYNQSRYFEGDASMFDQSQSFGPLAFERACLKRLGVSNECRKLLELLSVGLYEAKSRDGEGKITVDRTLRAMRDTGGSDTSLGNSLNMGFAWVIVLLQVRPIEDSFKDLGFEMKLKVFDHITDVTFLKGMWYEVCGLDWAYYWGPLPSRFLKLGKSLKDPRSLYDRVLWQTYDQAVCLFLNDLAHCYRDFLQIPLVRVFVKNFLNGSVVRDLSEKYKVTGSVGAKPNFNGWAQICRRYCVSLGDWEECENMIPKSPFHFLQHPLLEALVVDYN
jgi:hypothetical protein